MHILLISMDDITPKLEKHEVLGSRTTLDRDFVPWTEEAVVRLLHRCGTTLGAELQADTSVAAAVAMELLAAAKGDLRMITVIGQRMDDALCAAGARITVDLLTLAHECVVQHRTARDQREARAKESPARRTRRRKAA
jgi:hypothetical protein